MSVPNQDPRQLFLYDHGRPPHHWSQGGPLFYDRRMPPPHPHPNAHGPGAGGGPHHMGNHFQNQPVQGAGPPAPQWLRGPLLGGHPPGHGGPAHNNHQQMDGFGFNMPWNMPANNHHHHHNNNHYHHHHHRNNNNNSRHFNHRGNNGRGGGGQGGRNGGEGGGGEQRYLCCKCGDYLQNSHELGVHLCDANTGDNQQQQQPAGQDVNMEEYQNNLSLLLAQVKEKCEVELIDQPSAVGEAVQSYFEDFIQRLVSMRASLASESSKHQERLEELTVQQSAVEERAQQLKQQQEELTRQRAKAEEDGKVEQAELARQWQQLRDEITRMEEVNSIQEGRVKLDVGGHVFTTSQLTLTREADSMLAAMFSGRHALKKENDGTIFIDRDGTHFRYILNYLRDGGISTDALPRSKQSLRELRNEAVYFQLHGLIQSISKVLPSC